MVKGVTVDLEVPADADLVIEGFVTPSSGAGARGALRRPHRLLLAGRRLPVPRGHGHHAPPGRRLPGHRGGAAAHGGLLDGHRHRAALPAHAPAGLPRGGGHGLPARGGLPQPLLPLHPEGVPRPRPEAHARPVGLGADVGHQDAGGLRRGRRRARLLPVRLARLRQRGRASATWWWWTARSTCSTTPRTAFGLGAKVGVDATRKWVEEGGREWPEPCVHPPEVLARMDALYERLVPGAPTPVRRRASRRRRPPAGRRAAEAGRERRFPCPGRASAPRRCAPCSTASRPPTTCSTAS